MIRVTAATMLVAWASGGWFFLWITTRRRELGIGYGWLLRSIYLFLTAGSITAAVLLDSNPARDAFILAFMVAGLTALATSVTRRKAGIDGFPPVLDLAAALLGLAAAIVGAATDGGSLLLAITRILVGALFLGAVTDTMLLGHWYLVQPGLRRAPLLQLVKASTLLWIPETIVMLIPTGMVSVLNGTIDDGYNGILGWFWAVCVVATIGLLALTRAALKEREYSAVMAATGLVYLAIVTAFGQDLVARILLAP